MKRMISSFILFALAVGTFCGCSSKAPESAGSPGTLLDFPERYIINTSIDLLEEMKQTYSTYKEQIAIITDSAQPPSSLSDEDFFNIDFYSPNEAFIFNIDQNYAFWSLQQYGKVGEYDLTSDFFDELMAEIPGQYLSYIMPVLFSEGSYSTSDIAKIGLISWLAENKTTSASSPNFSNYILFLGYNDSVVVSSFIKDDSDNIRYRINHIIPGLSAQELYMQYVEICQSVLDVDITSFVYYWPDMSKFII